MELMRAAQLQAKISKGELPQLTLVRNRLRDIEVSFLARLEKGTRMAREEEAWLTHAERMLQTCIVDLDHIEEQFKDAGPGQIEIE
jgi:hypothetical protein